MLKTIVVVLLAIAVANFVCMLLVLGWPLVIVGIIGYAFWAGRK